MRKADFERLNEPRWRELQALVEQVEKKARGAETSRLPGLLRQVCGDLALAQHRMYGRKLCERLNRLVVDAYGLLHRGKGGFGESFVRFALGTFPAAVRAEWRALFCAMALFWVPFGAMILAATYAPHWIFSLVDPATQEMMDGMYGREAEPVEYFREKFGANFMMFAYYVWNNISISLVIFATGIVFMLGSVWSITYQGLILGAMFGYVHYTGNADKIWRFAVSHSSFELLGIIICGVAGMRLGRGVMFRGQLTLSDSIKQSGKAAMPLLFGGIGMVFLAAVVEGFWSGRGWIPDAVKYTFGIAMWFVWALYFLLVGRGLRPHA